VEQIERDQLKASFLERLEERIRVIQKDIADQSAGSLHLAREDLIFLAEANMIQVIALFEFGMMPSLYLPEVLQERISIAREAIEELKAKG
jgi:hypothetical protein